MTTPDPMVLPPLNDPPELEAELRRYAAFIDEMLAYGTRIFGLILKAGEAPRDPDEGTAIAIVALHFRWGLELLGSMSAQVRNGWIEPSAVTVRSLFETTLAFEYLISDRTLMAKRARAYLFMNSRRRLDLLEAMDPTPNVGSSCGQSCGRTRGSASTPCLLRPRWSCRNEES